jgi:Uma2 family endonuclease
MGCVDQQRSPKLTAMPTRTLLTVKEFEKYQDDGKKHELIQGEHVTLPPAKRPHTRVQQNLQDALRPYVREHQLGEVHIEAGFKLSSNTWLQPDVSFVRSAQMQRGDPNEYYEGAPALAIEVASESNSAAQLDLKMELYFAHGAEEVWVVYPKTRRIRVHFPDGHSETLASGLQSALFPGWSAPLSDLFA